MGSEEYASEAILGRVGLFDFHKRRTPLPSGLVRSGFRRELLGKDRDAVACLEQTVSGTQAKDPCSQNGNFGRRRELLAKQGHRLKRTAPGERDASASVPIVVDEYLLAMFLDL